MRIKNYFLSALAAVALVGCSNELVNETPDNAVNELLGDKGYINLALQMPTRTVGTRSANDDLDDGTPDEYRVEDILLVLFGTNTSAEGEDAATLRSAYNLSDQRNAFGTVGTTTDQITSSAGNLVAEIMRSTLTDGGNLYAYVILNDHQFYEVTNGTLHASAKGDVENGARDLTGVTFAEFKKLIMDESGRNYAESSFFMSNAPVVSDHTNYWQGSASTLVQFDASKIYPTYDEAKSDPAATINVERALAKVQAQWDPSAITNLKKATSIPAEIIAWDLDNVNTVTYNTRNFDGAWQGYVNSAVLPAYDSQKYRMQSPAMIAIADPHAANTTLHRTYWGVDPNYDVVASTSAHPLQSIAGQSGTDADPNALVTKRANNGIYYCPENTFNVEHQSVENTTRLVVAARLNNGDPFYTLIEKNASIIYQTVASTTDPNYDNSIQKYIVSAIANRVNVRTWAQSHLTVTVDDTGDWAKNLFTVTFDNPTTSGEQVAHISIATTAPNSMFVGGDKAAAETSFNTTIKALCDSYLANEYHFYYYPGGVSYYQALIKHFGNELCPWTRSEGMANVTIGPGSIYGTTDAEANFLGRYGIVRNNWYIFNIEGLNYVGESTIPGLDDTPDDSVDNYISVRINILPWAKRTQSETL